MAERKDDDPDRFLLFSCRYYVAGAVYHYRRRLLGTRGKTHQRWGGLDRELVTATYQRHSNYNDSNKSILGSSSPKRHERVKLRLRRLN